MLLLACLIESRLHDAALCLLAALNVLVQHLGDGLVFVYVSRFAHGFTPASLDWVED